MHRREWSCVSGPDCEYGHWISVSMCVLVLMSWMVSATSRLCISCCSLGRAGQTARTFACELIRGLALLVGAAVLELGDGNDRSHNTGYRAPRL